MASEEELRFLRDKKLRWGRRLSVVPRWSVVPTVRKQNVAEHSYHVVMLCMWMMPFLAGGSDLAFQWDVVRLALAHDLEEAADGDAPSPSRPVIDYSTADQAKVVVKVADILEAYLFMQEETCMGNTHNANPVIDYLTDKVFGMAKFVEFDADFEREATAYRSSLVACTKSAASLTDEDMPKACAMFEILMKIHSAVFNASAVHPGMEKKQ